MRYRAVYSLHALEMPTAQQLETLNDPYFLFYRLFIGLRAVVKSVEACGDAVLALDRSLHSTLLPSALPVQQRRIAESIFELLSFSVTRERRACADRIATRIYGSKRVAKAPDSLENSSPSGNPVVLAVMIDGNTGETIVISKLSSRPSVSGLPSVEEESQSQDVITDVQELEHSTIEVTGEEMIQQDDDTARLSKMYLPECPKHTTDCPYSKNTKGKASKSTGSSSNDYVFTPFSTPSDFIRMGYVENPEILLKMCPVCAAQAVLQSTWLCISLFQQLDVVGLAHLSLAPLPIPQELECLTPREGLAHVYHLAQRFFENGLHYAMMQCQEVPLVDRLSYPVPLLLSAARPQLKKRDLSTETTAEEESSSQIKDEETKERSLFRSSHLINSPFLDLSMDEEAHRRKMYHTVGVLCHGCTHLSLRLLQSIPSLCPVLEIYKNTPEHRKESVDSATEIHGAVLDSIRSEYSLHDVFVEIRAGLQEVCLFGFLDASQGAVKAQRKLLQLCKVIVQWERDTIPQKKGGKHTPRKEHGSTLGLGPADQIYYFYSNLWNDREVMNDWPWNQSSKSWIQPSRPILKECERDQVGEYYELKQIIFLMTVFFDLVEDKDDREEVEALEEYLRNHTKPIVGSPPFAIDGVMLNYEALAESARDLYSRRKAEHYSRLCLAESLLEEKIKPVLSELANSSNGGTTSRARQLMALLYLLKAEIIRFRGEGSAIEEEQGEIDRCVSEANTQAIKQTEAAREFLGVTMQPATPPLPSPSTSQRFERKSDQESDPKSPTSWRLLIPIQNSGSRDILLQFKEKYEKGDPGCQKRSGDEIVALGLLPPLWIRMWLILGRAVFRSSASDMILAKENTIPPSISTPKESGSAASPPALKEKKTLRKKTKPPPSDVKKMTKKELREQQETERCIRTVGPATLKLKYSLQETCFWHRWHELFIDPTSSSKKELSVPLDGTCSTHPGENGDKYEIQLDSIPFLMTLMHGLLCSFSFSDIPPTSTPGVNHLSSSLQNDYPIFSSGETAFSSLIKFGGSRRAEPHPCSFAQMDRQFSLFLAPSVSACTPAIAKLVAGYWKKLGSPSLPLSPARDSPKGNV